MVSAVTARAVSTVTTPTTGRGLSRDASTGVERSTSSRTARRSDRRRSRASRAAERRVHPALPSAHLHRGRRRAGRGDQPRRRARPPVGLDSSGDPELGHRRTAPGRRAPDAARGHSDAVDSAARVPAAPARARRIRESTHCLATRHDLDDADTRRVAPRLDPRHARRPDRGIAGSSWRSSAERAQAESAGADGSRQRAGRWACRSSARDRRLLRGDRRPRRAGRRADALGHHGRHAAMETGSPPECRAGGVTSRSSAPTRSYGRGDVVPVRRRRRGRSPDDGAGAGRRRDRHVDLVDRLTLTVRSARPGLRPTPRTSGARSRARASGGGRAGTRSADRGTARSTPVGVDRSPRGTCA